MKNVSLLSFLLLVSLGIACPAFATIVVNDSQTGIWHVTNQAYVQEDFATGGVNISFGASAYIDCGSGQVCYEWDFGDNTAHGFGANVQHLYSLLTEGTYTITVTMTADNQQPVTKTFTLKFISGILISNIGGIPRFLEGALGPRLSFNNACTVQGSVLPGIFNLAIPAGWVTWEFSSPLTQQPITGNGILSALPLLPVGQPPNGAWPKDKSNGAGINYWGAGGVSTLTFRLTLPLINVTLTEQVNGVKRYFERMGFQNGKRNPLLFGGDAWPNWFCYWRHIVNAPPVQPAFFSYDNTLNPPGITEDEKQPLYKDPANLPAPRVKNSPYGFTMSGTWTEGGQFANSGFCGWDGLALEWRSYLSEPAQGTHTCYGAGVNFFSAVCRHEEMHRRQFRFLWGLMPPVLGQDVDGDGLPDRNAPQAHNEASFPWSFPIVQLAPGEIAGPPFAANLGPAFLLDPRIAGAPVGTTAATRFEPLPMPVCSLYPWVAPPPPPSRDYDSLPRVPNGQKCTYWDLWAYWPAVRGAVSVNSLEDCEDSCEIEANLLQEAQRPGGAVPNFDAEDWAHPGNQWP